MNRYAIENLFEIEGLNIAWYGIIIACGMVLGFALAIYRCRKTGINKEHIYDLALWLIPICIICIRASQVLSGCLIILGIVILFIIRKRQAVRQ